MNSLLFYRSNNQTTRAVVKTATKHHVFGIVGNGIWHHLSFSSRTIPHVRGHLRAKTLAPGSPSSDGLDMLASTGTEPAIKEGAMFTRRSRSQVHHYRHLFSRRAEIQVNDKFLPVGIPPSKPETFEFLSHGYHIPSHSRV
jgi:hypothetical protein